MPRRGGCTPIVDLVVARGELSLAGLGPINGGLDASIRIPQRTPSENRLQAANDIPFHVTLHLVDRSEAVEGKLSVSPSFGRSEHPYRMREESRELTDDLIDPVGQWLR